MALDIQKRRIVERDGIVGKSHGGAREPRALEDLEAVIRPRACLAADTRPRYLEHRAHGHARGATIQRIDARGAYQDAVDIERGGGAKDRTDVGMIDNALEHAHAHRATVGTLDESVEKGTRIGKRRSAKRRKGSTRDGEARELLQQVHRPNKNRDLKLRMRIGDLVEQR